MKNRLRTLMAWLSIKFMTYTSSPETIKSEMKETLGINKINAKLEDKIMEPMANNAWKVTKFCLKLALFVFILFVIALLLYSMWAALSITYNGEVIK